jgi:hypothetical protein
LSPISKGYSVPPRRLSLTTRETNKPVRKIKYRLLSSHPRYTTPPCIAERGTVLEGRFVNRFGTVLENVNGVLENSRCPKPKKRYETTARTWRNW